MTISNAIIIGGTVGLDSVEPIFDDAKNEITYLRTGYPAAEGNVDLTLFIAFSKPEIIKRQPAIRVLDEMRWQTEIALHAIEAKTTEIISGKS